ncbi:thymocyte nuclear protein [Spatholobus suberectus]|nr:thymocyte nuclear protein [Spatholobus suberectus]
MRSIISRDTHHFTFEFNLFVEHKEWVDDAVDVREMRRLVDLKEMKQFKGFTLFRLPRLSVVPVPDHIWNQICDLGCSYDHNDAR